MKALILLSGGIDSATALAKALEEGKDPVCLSFDYGQRHRIELESAKNIASHYALPHTILRLDPSLFSSPLVGNEKPFPKQSSKMPLPVANVPYRNLLFLSMAAAFAESHGCGEMHFSAHREDAAYPDCRIEFFKAFQRTLDLGSSRVDNLQLILPFISLSKKEVVSLAKKLEVPLILTWSCYDPQGSKPCGTCLACEIRQSCLD